MPDFSEFLIKLLLKKQLFKNSSLHFLIKNVFFVNFFYKYKKIIKVFTENADNIFVRSTWQIIS